MKSMIESPIAPTEFLQPRSLFLIFSGKTSVM